MRTRAADAVLEARGVTVKVKDKVILDDIGVTVRSGELLALLGPTGGYIYLHLLYITSNVPGSDILIKNGFVSNSHVYYLRLPTQFCAYMKKLKINLCLKTCI